MGTQEQLEQILRDLRRKVFSDDPAVAAEAEAAIPAVKAQLAPYWTARADAVRARADERFLFLTD